MNRYKYPGQYGSDMFTREKGRKDFWKVQRNEGYHKVVNKERGGGCKDSSFQNDWR